MGVLMFKKIFIGFMLSFIVIIQIGCCNLYTKNKNKLDTNTFYLNQKLKNYKNSPLHNQNFVFLFKYILTKNHKDYNEICYNNTKKIINCNDPLVPINSASGYIVKVDKKNNILYAVTAAHWCEPVKKEELYDITELNFDAMPLIASYANFMGNVYRIKKISIDYRNDICLIEFNSDYAKYAKNINVAKSIPDIGEPVYAIAAPEWSHVDEIRQHYTGKFAGCDNFTCSFTLPATYGSSGSAIINKRGEIISIISMASVDFNNYTLGPKLENLQLFLESNL